MWKLLLLSNRRPKGIGHSRVTNHRRATKTHLNLAINIVILQILRAAHVDVSEHQRDVYLQLHFTIQISLELHIETFQAIFRVVRGIAIQPINENVD